jgi:putative membrane protein
MAKLLVHLLVSALLLWLVSQIVPGIHIASFSYALLAALVLGLVNFLVRPILIIVTLPITILTLGLFLIVINALMLMLTGAIVPGFQVAGFGAALLGGVLLGLFNLAASAMLNRSARRPPLA